MNQAAVERLTEETYLALFGDTELAFDLHEGTLRAQGGNRQVLLSVDALNGVYKSLSHETGDAWRVVMKNCGVTWGRRCIERIQLMLQEQLGRRLEDLSVAEFCELVEHYFSYHGWGVVQIHLENAETDGLLRVVVFNSVLTQALGDVQGKTDYLLAGMFRSIFEQISGHELDCVQVTRERGEANGCNEFVVSGMQRLVSLDADTAEQSFEDVVEALRAA